MCQSAHLEANTAKCQDSCDHSCSRVKEIVFYIFFVRISTRSKMTSPFPLCRVLFIILRSIEVISSVIVCRK